MPSWLTKHLPVWLVRGTLIISEHFWARLTPNFMFNLFNLYIGHSLVLLSSCIYKHLFWILKSEVSLLHIFLSKYVLPRQKAGLELIFSFWKSNFLRMQISFFCYKHQLPFARFLGQLKKLCPSGPQFISLYNGIIISTLSCIGRI